MDRRSFLKLLGAGAAVATARWPLFDAIAEPSRGHEFFIFIHAAGGWDVTLWADPRNERKGLIEPASTENTDVGGLALWKGVPLADGVESFEPVRTPRGHRLGPAIGSLLDLADRMTVVNGLAMNTVSHPDGTVFSATGRHLAGGRVPASSIDSVVGSELGATQLLPVVSVLFPSVFTGQELDPRAIPLRVANIGALARTLGRSTTYDTAVDRDEVTMMLSEEAEDLARRSLYPDVWNGLASQLRALPHMVGGDLVETLSAKSLQAAHPEFNYKSKTQAQGAITASFAVEAMRKNLVRCVGFNLGGLDTHNLNYKGHAATLQDLFDLVATLVKTLDRTPHPTRANDKLGEHTHILVVSEFCRTPQINLQGGRDHYPNNSALVISPRFRGDTVYGKSDLEQLLPAEAGTFAAGKRAVAPPDLLSTFVAAVGIDPRRHFRDGEVVKELLRG